MDVLNNIDRSVSGSCRFDGSQVRCDCCRRSRAARTGLNESSASGAGIADTLANDSIKRCSESREEIGRFTIVFSYH